MNRCIGLLTLMLLPVLAGPLMGAEALPDPYLASPAQTHWRAQKETHGAARLWRNTDVALQATVNLTVAQIGDRDLARLMPPVMAQIEKQFGIKPVWDARQFKAARALGYKITYPASGRSNNRYQVQYFIPRNGALYVLTCSCPLKKQLLAHFDGFADSFLPPQTEPK